MTARILYIEDRNDNRLLVKRVLMAEGMEVFEADNAREGINLAVEYKPDLILMDISMPGMDGYAATNEIRRLHALDTVPIVALTANVMKGDREKSLEAGCDGYIPKPIDIDRFPGEILGFIQKGRSPQPAQADSESLSLAQASERESQTPSRPEGG